MSAAVSGCSLLLRPAARARAYARQATHAGRVGSAHCARRLVRLASIIASPPNQRHVARALRPPRRPRSACGYPPSALFAQLIFYPTMGLRAELPRFETFVTVATLVNIASGLLCAAIRCAGPQQPGARRGRGTAAEGAAGQRRAHGPCAAGGPALFD